MRPATPDKFVLAYLNQCFLYDEEKDLRLKKSITIKELLTDFYQFQKHTGYEFGFYGNPEDDYSSPFMIQAFSILGEMGMINLLTEKDKPLKLDDEIEISNTGRVFGALFELPEPILEYLEQKAKYEMDLPVYIKAYEIEAQSKIL